MLEGYGNCIDCDWYGKNACRTQRGSELCKENYKPRVYDENKKNMEPEIMKKETKVVDDNDVQEETYVVEEEKTKYDFKLVYDFLENDDTTISWNTFADMLYDKFGEEADELINTFADMRGKVIIDRDALDAAKNALNSL